ncbi:jg21190 [Pararge aegeria aegeria]|uniref:Elongation of very long chain fatty acids protein n=1 Tax=Pararge aegeria aegeria TaxID=348720 RepID=A0A8S4SB76_9NEOP|nr:jg21190 [Pararge aegeria aegeria]
MEIIKRIVDGYHDLMDNQSDPRIKDWFLMSSPFPTLAICLTYVFTVKILGPKLMEDRKPFELKRVLIWYNLFQVIFSCWLFNESIATGWFSTYSFRCQPVDYSRSPHAMRIANGCWWYYISKFTEFFDTLTSITQALRGEPLNPNRMDSFLDTEHIFIQNTSVLEDQSLRTVSFASDDLWLRNVVADYDLVRRLRVTQRAMENAMLRVSLHD